MPSALPQVSTPPQAATAEATPTEEKTIVPGGAESGTAMKASNPSNISKSTPATMPPTGPNGFPISSGLTLHLAATEQTWIAVEADGKTAMQGILKPNEIQTFKAKEFFDLRTGNAQGIILTLNGETLKPLGRQGEFKKVHLTRNDLKSHNP